MQKPMTGWLSNGGPLNLPKIKGERQRELSLKREATKRAEKNPIKVELNWSRK